MPVTITLHDSLARTLEKQAGLRNVSLEQWAVEVLLGQSEAAAAQPKEPPRQWDDEKNARRCDLIDRQIEGTIAPAERRELDDLQSQLRRHLDEVAPFDLAAARKIHQQLLQKKRESESQRELPRGTL
jgi:hypothetical protein